MATTVQGDEITIGDYLLERLAQLGVTKIFGVPGDFNLAFLDLVEDHKSIEWIGNCNELNASYAADGYARVKEDSIGVVITTFGVGELSGINGIAGAFSEYIPVLHVVGVPSTVQQKTKPMLHHTLGDGRFNAYLKAAEQFTVAQADLQDTITAPSEIDRVLQTCFLTARPVYLALPTDLVYAKTPRARLDTPIDTVAPPNDPDKEGFVIREILKAIDDADKNVIILVDACAVRHNVRREVAELIERTGFPVYAAPMGKTAVSEQSERYGGIYVGSLTREDIKEKVESANLILSVGALKSDFNTGNFTYRIPAASTIELHSTVTEIRYAVYPGIGMRELLPKLTARLEPLKPDAQNIPVPKFEALVPQEDNDVITHTWLWPRVGKFFKPKDVIVAETGTSSFGILDVPLPDGSIFVSQILWGSIGWTVGSTLGAALASKDVGLGRTLLFIGDGSLQLSVQEISTIIRQGLSPVIFVLNNSGYTVERHIRGRDRKYNDIANWRWTSLLSVFQGEPGEKEVGRSYTVRTKDELSTLLDDPAFARADTIQLVEILMGKYDAPPALLRQAEGLNGKTNAYTAACESLRCADSQCGKLK